MARKDCVHLLGSHGSLGMELLFGCPLYMMQFECLHSLFLVCTVHVHHWPRTPNTVRTKQLWGWIAYSYSKFISATCASPATHELLHQYRLHNMNVVNGYSPSVCNIIFMLHRYDSNDYLIM